MSRVFSVAYQLELFGEGNGMTPVFIREKHVFDLVNLDIVGRAIRFFEDTPALDLPPPKFRGCGVYALYYVGNFAAYKSLSRLSQEALRVPIYVGKAVPPGRRTARRTTSNSRKLYQRLQEHKRSIIAAENLRQPDFRCRVMILPDKLVDLIVPIESNLIREYFPLWNSVIDGFGNHPPGVGRSGQAPSEWDVLHPGRPWASKLTGSGPSREDVVSKVKQYAAKLSPP